MSWNPTQYLKFKKERTQPAIDLVARIPLRTPSRILDLGCGPGNSTAVLAEAFPNASILGVDYSQSMIDAAKAAYPKLDFLLFDATTDFARLPKTFDVVFSNACIQWVPDHPTLLQNMLGVLNEHGVLAVQVPINDQEPIHQIIQSVAQRPEWVEKFPHSRVFHTLSPYTYFDLLSRLHTDVTMWETIYYHRMPSHDSILEWYSSTGLRPYLSVLDDADRRRFLAAVRNDVIRYYPVSENGEILFRFPRLFWIAER